MHASQTHVQYMAAFMHVFQSHNHVCAIHGCKYVCLSVSPLALDHQRFLVVLPSQADPGISKCQLRSLLGLSTVVSSQMVQFFPGVLGSLAVLALLASSLYSQVLWLDCQAVHLPQHQPAMGW